MITQLIFDWAKRTPDRTAVIYNGQPLSYRWFAQAIAAARGYFVRRGYAGLFTRCWLSITGWIFGYSAWPCAAWA